MTSATRPAASPTTTSPGGATRPRAGLLPVLLVMGSIVSLQVGSGYATTLFDRAGSTGVTTLRLGLAALVMLLVTRPRLRSWSRPQWRVVLMFGLSLALMNSFFYAAIARIPFGIALAFEFLGPLGLAAALSRRPRDFLWVALALAGVATIGVHNADAGSLDLLGVLFALLAASAWAAYIVLGARVSTVVPGHQGLAAALATAAVMLLPFGIVTSGGAVLSLGLLLPGLAVALFSSVLPYTFEMQALKTMPKKMFSILLALEPAAGVLTGALMLGQHLDPLTIAAIGVVVVAGIGATLGRPDRPARRGLRRRRANPGDAVLT
ncbi:EamA family transporter [Cumulibacter manganitolerans]|uniref:EamA family transporter n=1 Tax=Cumulibacter manganitolerans TaxID=1884992 RepID=UPI0012949560|nr:EamA family transporter [Cumulibacter manganitolerans]